MLVNYDDSLVHYLMDHADREEQVFALEAIVK